MAVRGKNRRLGLFGEARAARYLKRSGYKIVERNLRTPFGEVDIVAKKGDVLAFVEVKTRSGRAFGLPNEAVRRDRMARYINAAKYYFSGREMDVTVRFDIIELLGGGINHIEDAFSPSDL